MAHPLGLPPDLLVLFLPLVRCRPATERRFAIGIRRCGVDRVDRRPVAAKQEAIQGPAVPHWAVRWKSEYTSILDEYTYTIKIGDNTADDNHDVRECPDRANADAKNTVERPGRMECRTGLGDLRHGSGIIGA